MTREEAIFILRGKRNIVGEKTAEALDIAIKAIEQEPKIGRWTADRNCSRCGCRSMLGLCIENYCANCGAKMVKSQAENEG